MSQTTSKPNGTVTILQTKSKVPALTIEDLLDFKEEPTVDELLDLKEPVQKEETSSHKKSKKRTSSRIKKKPQRYADIDWERWGNDENDVLRGE
jgi:hypothetical protein